MFSAYSIQRFTVLLSKDHTRAVIHKVRAADPADEKLRQFAARLREPVMVTTERFGKVVMNPLTGCFEARVKWNRKTVELLLSREEDGGIGEAIKTAESL